MNYDELALKIHKEKLGKIEVGSKVSLETREDMSIYYTPGVAAPCLAIREDVKTAYDYTAKGNLVAVVTDGSAVLGLGNIGALAGMPVMEGKSILFKKFANVDAFPICLDTQDTEEIITAVKMIAPTFGGINLEDISAPKCFEIEKRLETELEIPVFHDDQHGTAIVVTAALINALKIVGKKVDDLKVVLNGPGAAGTAIIKMLAYMGVKNFMICDSKGLIYNGRPDLVSGYKMELMELSNPENIQGGLKEAIVGADVFVGVSVAGALTKEMIATMNPDPIVFAMANPAPEIMYEEAIEAGVKVMGTGRSDYPNQINNVLAFPGIFKGALSARARNINYEMKIAAAKAIAELVTEDKLAADYVIPSALEAGVADCVAKRVRQVAIDTGVARD